MDINSILPNEILSHIFHKLKSKDLRTIRVVCPLWRTIVDETVGVKLYLGSQPPGHYWPKSKRALFKPISAIREYGASKCYINRMEQSGPFTRQLDPTFTWLSPHLLMSMRIDGHIHPHLFNHVTKGLLNLKSLTLHFNVLANLQPLDLKFGPLANLEEFSIHHIFDDLKHFVNMEGGILQGVTLLESRGLTFPRLRSVEFCWPASPSYLRILHRAMICFCRRHASTLKKLDILYYELEFVPPLKPLRRDPGPQLTLADFQGINLESFQFNVVFDWMYPEMDIFIILMNQQQRMKSVKFSALPELVHILPPIQNCMETLTKVDFTVDMEVRPPGAPLNLAIFGSCHNLAEFKVSLYGLGDRPEETEPDVTFGGVRLPNSLRVVQLYGLLMSTQDVLTILDDKPLLQDVDLRDIGTHGTFGVPFSKFFQIYRDRQIKDIYLNSALNEDSVRGGAESEDPSIKLASEFLRMGLEGTTRRWNQGLSLRLDSRGFYRINGHPLSIEAPPDVDFDEEDNDD